HDEYIIEAIPVREFSEKQFLIFFTKQGMVKKSTLNLYDSPRYSRSMIALNLREDDELINVSQSNGQDYIFLASNIGNGLLIHDEYIIEAIPVREFSEKQFLIFFTKQGMVKKSTLNLYDSPRYSRSMIALNLREDDELINVSQSNGQDYIFLASNIGNGLLIH